MFFLFLGSTFLTSMVKTHGRVTKTFGYRGENSMFPSISRIFLRWRGGSLYQNWMGAWPDFRAGQHVPSWWESWGSLLVSLWSASTKAPTRVLPSGGCGERLWRWRRGWPLTSSSLWRRGRRRLRHFHWDCRRGRATPLTTWLKEIRSWSVCFLASFINGTGSQRDTWWQKPSSVLTAVIFIITSCSRHPRHHNPRRCCHRHCCNREVIVFILLMSKFITMLDVLHWLPFQQIANPVSSCLLSLAPAYLRDLCCPTSGTRGRSSVR